MHPFLFGYDFYYLWSVGALVHQGVDPYNIDLLRQQLYSLGWPATEIPQKFTHPPNTLWLYWLLAIVPFKISLLVWSCISCALIITSSLILARALTLQGSLSRQFVLYAAALFPPSLGTIIWGQVNAVLLFGIALFALGWARGAFFYAGMGLSLVLIKPHIFVPLLTVVLVWEILSKRWSCVVGCACGILCQIGASYAVAPDCIEWYRRALDGIVGESMLICGATLGQFIECQSGLRSIRPLLLVVGCIVALRLAKLRGYSLVTLLGVILPLSVCVSPYCWMHSLVMLLPGLVCIGSYLSCRFSERAMMYSLAVATVVTLPLIVQGGWQPVWILLSWGVFLSALCTTQGCEATNVPTSS